MIQVRPEGPAPARIMIVGEAPGETEVEKGLPFVGYSGQELNKMLAEAGLARSQCFVTNVCRERPPGNDMGHFVALRKTDITAAHRILRDKYCLPQVWEGLEMLKREIEMVRPNVIIAFGNYAMWALTGRWGITSWRGSILESDLDLSLDYHPKVIPAYHPAAVLRNWPWRPIVVHDLRRAKIESAFREIKRPDYKFVIRPDFTQVISILDQLLSQLTTARDLAVDIETRQGHIACIGLAWSNRAALCIPLMCSERIEGYWTPDEEFEIVWRLYQLLTHSNCHVIGQNFLYDAQYIFWHWCFIPNCTYDTMLGQHVCYADGQKGLDYLASMHCEFYEYWKDEGKEWDANTGEDQLWEYNCKDAVNTFECAASIRNAVQVMGLQTVDDFQQSLFAPVLDIMNRGVRIDQNRRNRFAMELCDEIAKRQAWLEDVVGYPINTSSPKQMQEFFYDQLGQHPIYNRKTGNLTCDDEALGKLANREPLLRPLIGKVQELRSLGVFLSTFVSAPLDPDGRVRCSYNIGGTETYRFSSGKNAFGRGLNLQNVPAGGGADDDREIEESWGELELPNVRTLFIPDPGFTFFDVDLSSADLRIVVWEADEPEMKAMLREGLDPYTEIAKEFYHDQSITKEDHRRQKFKSFAHGTNYLGTAKGLAERLGLGISEAEKTQRWYFGKFPKIERWQNDLKDQVVKRHMVQNVFGYRRYYFDRIEGTIFNQAAAWIPQSTVARVINQGLVCIRREHPAIQVLLQVHDSLAGQVPTGRRDELLRLAVAACAVTLPYPGDPLTIPVGIKASERSWGECEKVKL